MNKSRKQKHIYIKHNNAENETANKFLININKNILSKQLVLKTEEHTLKTEEHTEDSIYYSIFTLLLF